MNNYIDLSRNILKNFDNEFDDIIKKILSTLFDDYYMNRNSYIYCIDNLNKIETKISLHRVSCEDHNHQGLT